MSTYTRFVRPILFRMQPEEAQRVAKRFLRAELFWRMFTSLKSSRLHTELAGIDIPNPIGLAAGCDKDCLDLKHLGNLGFGYVVGGTVTEKPRPGNLGTRIVRDPKLNALVNSQGLPSSGVDIVAGKLSELQSSGVPRIVNIAGLSLDEFLNCYRRLGPLSAAIELNISCPNAEHARVFQAPDKLHELLMVLGPEKLGPLFVKLPPYTCDNERDNVMALVDVCMDHGVEGVTASNTLPVLDNRLYGGSGGQSGKPLLQNTLRMVAEIRHHAGDSLAINGCGGISSGEDALGVLRAGANTVQLYTGFVYEGPWLIQRIKRYLLKYMKREGISSLPELTGRASGDLPVPGFALRQNLHSRCIAGLRGSGESNLDRVVTMGATSKAVCR